MNALRTAELNEAAIALWNLSQLLQMSHAAQKTVLSDRMDHQNIFESEKKVLPRNLLTSLHSIK
jgi:hypothetical protein